MGMKICVTHHNACDCREDSFKKQIDALTAEAEERNKWVKIQATIVADLKVELDAMTNGRDSYREEMRRAYIDIESMKLELEAVKAERDEKVKRWAAIMVEDAALRSDRDHWRERHGKLRDALVFCGRHTICLKEDREQDAKEQEK